MALYMARRMAHLRRSTDVAPGDGAVPPLPSFAHAFNARSSPARKTETDAQQEPPTDAAAEVPSWRAPAFGPPSVGGAAAPAAGA